MANEPTGQHEKQGSKRHQPVGLVQHQESAAIEVRGSKLDEVPESAGRGDRDIDAPSQLLGLLALGSAAVETSRFHASFRAKLLSHRLKEVNFH